MKTRNRTNTVLTLAASLALATLMATSVASAATVFSGGNLNVSGSWDNGLPSSINPGTIAVDGSNGTTVFNFGAGSIVDHTAGTITSSGTNGFNITNGTWNFSGGKHVTRYFLSNGSTTVFNISGGTIELADVGGAQHMGAANNGTFSVSGSAVLDGTQTTTVVQTGGTVDIASDWTGSWTWGTYSGNDWKNLFTGNLIELDGGNIDGTTFDSTFQVTNNGMTLSLIPATSTPEPSTAILATLGLLSLGMTRGRRRR